MLDIPSIQSLVERSQSGDSVAFRVLYEHLSDRLFLYIVSRMRDRDGALDVLQDVFIDLWKVLPRFSYRSDEAFLAFVFVIAKRRLARVYRERKDSIPFDELQHSSLSNDLTASDDADLVSRALASLNEADRELVTLRHWSQYSFLEIAEILGKAESAVRVQHHRILKRLAVFFTQYP